MTSALNKIRLSNETEESASPERRREQDTRYCEMRGWDIAHIPEDLDVSVADSPLEHPKLSPWLTVPELVGKWAVPIADRVTTGLADSVTAARVAEQTRQRPLRGDTRGRGQARCVLR
jgi:hypothetical protein